MRILWLPLVLVAFAGCFSSPVDISECNGNEPITLYFTADHGLQTDMPANGSVDVGGFASAFLLEPSRSFLSDPIADSLLLTSDVVLELYSKPVGVPPLLDTNTIGTDPEGYQFFNMVGSDVALMPDGAVHYAAAIPDGEVMTTIHNITLPAGGFQIESGDSVRAFLSTLALDPQNRGHELLVGPAFPSQMRFTALCIASTSWLPISDETTPLFVPASQGLGVEDAAQEDVNRVYVPFTLDEQTERLTIELRESRGGPKRDMDMILIDSQDQLVWRGGSPAMDETMRLWDNNMDLLMPAGDYRVQIDSYSSVAYEGTLRIIQEMA